MTNQTESKTSSLYFGNVLTAFEQGAELDIRLRIALELMKEHGPHDVRLVKSGVVVGERGDLVTQGAEEWARFHLAAATCLIEAGEEIGWVKHLPENDGLNAKLRAHLRRQVRAQVYQQAAGQRIGPEEQVPGIERAMRVPERVNS